MGCQGSEETRTNKRPTQIIQWRQWCPPENGSSQTHRGGGATNAALKSSIDYTSIYASKPYTGSKAATRIFLRSSKSDYTKDHVVDCRGTKAASTQDKWHVTHRPPHIRANGSLSSFSSTRTYSGMVRSMRRLFVSICRRLTCRLYLAVEDTQGNPFNVTRFYTSHYNVNNDV
ncbi:hypothetical protein CHS0354_018956 [Potamilus streckersoni]|uniref:Uncharacterized protein n=1 Tax=Potamilus streckersoni TaxID=2493646 RepID=A0AAE0T6L5_9BIVA|nr:hypothetical protein CHS0354_018956 [Potamilus streckersoni]